MTTQTNEAYELMRAILQMGRRLRSNRADEAPSLAVMSMLAALHRSGPLATGELAKRERLAPQSMTRLLAELAQRQFVTREHNPLDARQALVRVTTKGLRALKQEMHARSTWLESAMRAQLSEKERAELLAASRLLRRVIEYDG